MDLPNSATNVMAFLALVTQMVSVLDRKGLPWLT